VRSLPESCAEKKGGEERKEKEEKRKKERKRRKERIQLFYSYQIIIE